MHLEFLLEEESAAAVLASLLPKLIGQTNTYNLHTFQGKQDLMESLPGRLKGYRKWLPQDWRVVVLVDRDDDDCEELKTAMEHIANSHGLLTRARSARPDQIRVLNRIAIEELESWFFGDIHALCAAYPGVPPSLTTKRGFRHSDSIAGGTWEQLERVLQRAGYYSTGMAKVEVARRVSVHMEPNRNTSKSFKCFRDGVQGLVT